VQETDALFRFSGGDARKLLNIIELLVSQTAHGAPILLTNQTVTDCLQENIAFYDKNGEQHYDIISAFIKSLRGSDPNGAIYWLARMLAGGEDPLFIARRMVILAAEDIGLANPNALLMANACFDAVHKIGMPEGRLLLSQAALYLATSPKSNSVITSIDEATALVNQTGDLPVPLHLRNAPTQLMKELGYAKEYKYAHSYDGNFVDQEFLPDKLSGTKIYTPGQNPREAEVTNYLKRLWKKYGYLMVVVFFCMFTPYTLLAQQKVNGKIIDAIDSTPIVGATVFIANTTVITTSNASGNYSITVPVEGSFDIVVSHISYQRVSCTIDTPKPSHTIDFILDINELSEVTVTARSNVKQSDKNLFWSRLLGKLPSKNGLEVLNPEEVYFYKNRRDNVLKVSSNEPIEIVNHEMGYHILYYLEGFEYKYREGEAFILGKPFFEELTPKNSKQKEQWEKRRQNVYSLSLMRFFRALYHKKTREEGFILVEADSIRNARTLFPLDSILQFDENKVDVTIKSYMYLGCMDRYISDDDIEYTHYTFTVTNRAQGYPTKRAVVVLPPQEFSIYSDGSYSGILRIHDPDRSIVGLSNTLPVDYNRNF